MHTSSAPQESGPKDNEASPRGGGSIKDGSVCSRTSGVKIGRNVFSYRPFCVSPVLASFVSLLKTAGSPAMMRLFVGS